MNQLDRIKGALADWIETRVSRFLFHATWSATVKSQASDGTVEVHPEDGRMPDQRDVPIVSGIPGVTISKVNVGARVRLAFDNGDPSKPYVALWDKGAQVEIRIEGTSKVTIASPSVILGDDSATEHVALGDTLQSYLGSLKTWADTLVLPSAAGPAGPPAVPSPTVPTVTATKAKVI